MHQSFPRSRDGNMANIVKIPWSNVNCEKDIVDTLIWNRWLLRVLGIWPLIYPGTTKIEKIIAMFSFVLCWLVLSLLLVLVSMYVFSERSIMQEKMKMLGPLGYVFFSMVKYFFLVARHRSIRQCMQILSADWRSVQEDHHRKIMIKDAEKGQLLSKFCIAFMYCGGLSYNTIMPFLSQTAEQNITVRPMAYLGFDSIFNLQVMPVYVFAFCLQCVTGIVMFNITTVVCCLAAMFVAHACGQIDIIIARMKNLVKGERYNSEQFEQCMAIIVQHHVRALRWVLSHLLHIAMRRIICASRRDGSPRERVKPALCRSHQRNVGHVGFSSRSSWSIKIYDFTLSKSKLKYFADFQLTSRTLCARYVWSSSWERHW